MNKEKVSDTDAPDADESHSPRDSFILLTDGLETNLKEIAEDNMF